MKKKHNVHYAWIILFICFAALLAVQGIRLSFGAFMQPWEKEFSIDRGKISLASFALPHIKAYKLEHAC